MSVRFLKSARAFTAVDASVDYGPLIDWTPGSLMEQAGRPELTEAYVRALRAGVAFVRRVQWSASEVTGCPVDDVDVHILVDNETGDLMVEAFAEYAWPVSQVEGQTAWPV